MQLCCITVYISLFIFSLSVVFALVHYIDLWFGCNHHLIRNLYTSKYVPAIITHWIRQRSYI